MIVDRPPRQHSILIKTSVSLLPFYELDRVHVRDGGPRPGPVILLVLLLPSTHPLISKLVTVTFSLSIFKYNSNFQRMTHSQQQSGRVVVAYDAVWKLARQKLKKNRDRWNLPSLNLFRPIELYYEVRTCDSQPALNETTNCMSACLIFLY